MSVLKFKLSGQAFDMPETTKAIIRLGKRWRKNARISLKMQDKINTGGLYDSIPVDVFEQKGVYYLDITPQAHYWEFVDKGVQGASRNIFKGQEQSPFKFGSGKGPKGLRGAIDKWVLQRGISGTRDAKGRFTTRKQTVWAISNAIYNRGLKPTFFISGTHQRIKKSLNKEVGPAFSKDVANALRTIISNNENTEVN